MLIDIPTYLLEVENVFNQTKNGEVCALQKSTHDIGNCIETVSGLENHQYAIVFVKLANHV